MTRTLAIAAVVILGVGPAAAAQSVVEPGPASGAQSGAPAAGHRAGPAPGALQPVSDPGDDGVHRRRADGADARALVPDLGLGVLARLLPRRAVGGVHGRARRAGRPLPHPSRRHRARAAHRATPRSTIRGALSPDGRTLAFVSTRARGTADIWLLDLASKTGSNLTDHPSGNFRPRWSPDGAWIAFTSDRDAEPGDQPGMWEAPAVDRDLRGAAGRHRAAPPDRSGRGGGEPVLVGGRQAVALLRDRPRRRLPREERRVPHRARLGGRRHRRARPGHRLAGDEAVAGVAAGRAHRLREPRRGRPGRPESPVSRPAGRDGDRGGGAQPELVARRRAGGLRAHRAARLHPAHGARPQPRPRVRALPARAVRVVLAGRRQHDLQPVPRSVLRRHRARVVEPERLEPRDHVRGRVRPANALPPRGDQHVLRRLVRRPRRDRPLRRPLLPAPRPPGGPRSGSSIPTAPTCGWLWTTR